MAEVKVETSAEVLVKKLVDEHNVQLLDRAERRRQEKLNPGYQSKARKRRNRRKIQIESRRNSGR